MSRSADDKSKAVVDQVFSEPRQFKAIEEVERSYDDPDTRAAYRAGLSTAAGICDVIAGRIEKVGRTKQHRSAAAIIRRIGDEIWAERATITVSRKKD